METLTDVLLVTANVGSLFDNRGDLEDDWLQQFYTIVHKYKPRFIAMHCQEVGGKEYAENMIYALPFFHKVQSSKEMSDFDRVCIYIDSYAGKTADNFTALGSIYFIHKSLENIQQYDFTAKEFRSVLGRNCHMGSLCDVTTVKKEKFQKSIWKDKKWSRKGYMRTRWMIHNQGLDLVNVHLFHDASNLEALKNSPSVYSKNRQKALQYVIDRITHDFGSMPYFLFGDFNFRVDIRSLVQDLSKYTDEQMLMYDGEKKKIIYENSQDNGHKEEEKVLFSIEIKKFEYQFHKLFRDGSGQELQKYDRETKAFQEDIQEEEISFLPSYPYSENKDKPTEYMITRCPSWCDRVLMSKKAQDIIRKNYGGKEVVYDIMGRTVCMGDHKPVFLSFALKSNVQCADTQYGPITESAGV